MKKSSNFNAKEFLKVKVLSPIESSKFKGGIAETKVVRKTVTDVKNVVVVTQE